MPGYPCCCGHDCSGCATTARNEYTAVISGIVNNGCADCDNLNGTFVLQFVESNASGCWWRYQPEAAICGYACLWMRIYQDIDGGHLCLFWSDSCVMTPIKRLGFVSEAMTIDCHDLDFTYPGYDPSFGQPCDATGATWRVHA